MVEAVYLWVTVMVNNRLMSIAANDLLEKEQHVKYHEVSFTQ